MEGCNLLLLRRGPTMDLQETDEILGESGYLRTKDCVLSCHAVLFQRSYRSSSCSSSKMQSQQRSKPYSQRVVQHAHPTVRRHCPGSGQYCGLKKMGNIICCTTIEKVEEPPSEDMHMNEKTTTLQGIIREASSLTLFPNT